ncbi:MAG TPA: putative addiction module antidote protein [bacterium]|nr:putative addiction module antidote protein [bacterium]HPN41999.1 putative addiction module antidote protein [bacterium]
MAYKVSRLDVADYLTDENTIAEYLSSVLAEGNTALLISAIGDVAKARGMSHIAELAGLGRESLYKALSPDSKPRFETIVKVLNALGITIQLTSIKDNVPEQAA